MWSKKNFHSYSTAHVHQKFAHHPVRPRNVPEPLGRTFGGFQLTQLAAKRTKASSFLSNLQAFRSWTNARRPICRTIEQGRQDIEAFSLLPGSQAGLPARPSIRWLTRTDRLQSNTQLLSFAPSPAAVSSGVAQKVPIGVIITFESSLPVS